MHVPVNAPRRGARLAALAEERGSQTAEYAMLGGVGAAACGALIALLKNKETLGTLVDAVINGLARFVGSWF